MPEQGLFGHPPEVQKLFCRTANMDVGHPFLNVLDARLVRFYFRNLLDLIDCGVHFRSYRRDTIGKSLFLLSH